MILIKNNNISLRKSMLLSSMLLLVLIGISCTSKVGSKTSTEAPAPVFEEPSETVVKTDTFPTTDIVLVEPDDIELPPYLALRLEKTSCFGKCPSFEIKLFSDGRAQWNGKHHIEREGLYETHVDEYFLERIFNRASGIQYFSLSDHYPVNGKYLSDLPNTITYLNNSEQEKSILRNHNGPTSLRQFENLLFNYFDDLNWEKLASD